MESLIREIEQDTLNTAFLTGVKQIDPKVLAALRRIDRKVFVRPEDKADAYLDLPLDIGHGQTISQPFVVALITHLIEPNESDKVLEVGCGSGYQAAILADLVDQVFGLEIIKELCEMSKENLRSAHIENVTIICGDGTLGLPKVAPFDKIVVSAAASKLPHRLLEQLKVGGILVLPKQSSAFDQTLVKINKSSPTEFSITEILPVRFVPLINS